MDNNKHWALRPGQVGDAVGDEGEADFHLQPKLFHCEPNTWCSVYTVGPKDLSPSPWPHYRQHTFINLLFTSPSPPKASVYLGFSVLLGLAT